jgi:hypothetical protein
MFTTEYLQINLQTISIDTSDAHSECLQMKLQILLIDTGDAYIWISSDDSTDDLDGH